MGQSSGEPKITSKDDDCSASLKKLAQ